MAKAAPSVAIADSARTRPPIGAAARPDAAAKARRRLAVEVAGTALGLLAECVVEILRPRPVTRLPQGPPSLLGVVNRHGRALPVVSVASLLGHSAPAATRATRIVVFDAGTLVGLLVDRVLAFVAPSQTGDAGPPCDIAALLARDFAALIRRAGTAATTVPPRVPDAAPERRVDHRDLALVGVELGGLDYALPIAAIAEVQRVPDGLVPLPGADPAVMGVFPWRGAPVALLALGTLLGQAPPPERGRSARIILLRHAGTSVGLLVDRVTAANLVDAASMAAAGRFDIVFCRNVLIYFDDASRRAAARNIFAALVPGGFVCLGHAASMARLSLEFEMRRFDDAIVYQRPQS